LLAAAAFALGLALGSAQPLTHHLDVQPRAGRPRSGEALGMRIMANKVTQIAVAARLRRLRRRDGAGPVSWRRALSCSRRA